jgi:hypothetical protein
MYQLHVPLPTVRRWRERWLVLQAVALTDLDVAARLTDVPRPGRPIEIADTQVCQIVRMALPGLTHEAGWFLHIHGHGRQSKSSQASDDN